MKRTVYNSTEGGAHIKGTVRISLKEFIEEHCKETIDKSKVQPLLSYADDADELIKKVIPLLQQDIENLDSVIINSRKGIAVSKGMKNLFKRPEYKKLLPKKKELLLQKIATDTLSESQNNRALHTILFFQNAIEILQKSKLKTILIMSAKNNIFSEAAHIASARNPLVNVTIYGASRQIQRRGIKVNPSTVHFLKNRKDANTRIERNIFILEAAQKAAKSLKKGYKKTLRLLKKYDKTKDDSLLRPIKKEKINLKDAEKYFETGNWAHPLLDAKKIVNNQSISSASPELKRAGNILAKAFEMKTSAIREAKLAEKKNHKKMTDLIKYNELLERAQELGRDKKDYEGALKAMREAVKLIPDKQEGRWGLASCLNHAGNLSESIFEYKKLVNDFPENHLYRFELGQALLMNGQIEEGIKEIGTVMACTDEFDSFLERLGDIYLEGDALDSASQAYREYLKRFPFDYRVWNKAGDCLSKMGKEQDAAKAYAKAAEIKS